MFLKGLKGLECFVYSPLLFIRFFVLPYLNDFVPSFKEMFKAALSPKDHVYIIWLLYIAFSLLAYLICLVGTVMPTYLLGRSVMNWYPIFCLITLFPMALLYGLVGMFVYGL